MEPYIGQLQQFGFNFAPRGWALCDGSLIDVKWQPALFAIIGSIYGGDGRKTFALPDLRSRAAIGYGHGPGLSSYPQGSKRGEVEVQLTIEEMPGHSHIVNIVAEAPNVVKPADQLLAAPDPTIYSDLPNSQNFLNEKALGRTGGGKTHSNMQPYLTLNWCIAVQGTYPTKQ